jgi:two-component system, OmpR family, alkaline phosphatase synthesis response regulator PhoP
MHKILIIEDEEGLVLSLEDRLQAEGYRVTSRRDGISGEEEARSGKYDLIILDVMLPERDGFQVCKNLRDSGITTPVLMLTARSSTLDTVTGLRTGADDYLRKPFDMQELLARVLAQLRRGETQSQKTGMEEEMYAFGDFTLDTKREELRRGEELIPLNTQEYRLLKFFTKNPQRVIGRNELLDEVWGYDSITTTRTVDVHVGWLRQKLGEQDEPRYLVTVRGRGYRFDPD